MTNHMNLWIKKARQQLIKDWGGCCTHLGCESTQDLEFAHIHETELSGVKGRGRKERYYDVINNPDDYRLVCHVCHLTHYRTKRGFEYKDEEYDKKHGSFGSEKTFIIAEELVLLGEKK